MSRHTTYRGTTIDMDTMRRDNENTPALGNAGTNAKGDRLDNGTVTRTSDQMARDNHRVQTTIVRAGLKGPVPAALTALAPAPEPLEVTKAPKAMLRKTKETELPSGDIVIVDDKDAS